VTEGCDHKFIDVNCCAKCGKNYKQIKEEMGNAFQSWNYNQQAEQAVDAALKLACQTDEGGMMIDDGLDEAIEHCEDLSKDGGVVRLKINNMRDWLKELRELRNPRNPLMEVLRRLEDMGVGYRKNYSGPFETRYPHSAYRFQIHIDRDGTNVVMCNAGGNGSYEPIAFCERTRGPGFMDAELITALERGADELDLRCILEDGDAEA